VGLNTSHSTIDSSTALFPTNALVMHPGPSLDSIVEWTAPANGTYSISGFFELLDDDPTGVIVYVYDNSTLCSPTTTCYAPPH